MLNSTPVQNPHTPFSDDTSTIPTSATLFIAPLVLAAGVVAALPITIGVWFLSMTGEPGEAMDKAEAMLWLYFLLVPIGIAGAYWLSLVRMRRVEALRTWLEALGFSFAYLLVMPVLLGVGSYVLHTLHLPNLGASSNPWSALVLFVDIPALILYALLEALLTSGIALGVAARFTDWRKVRAAHLAGHGWLDVLLVLGSVTVVTLLTGVAFAYFQDAFFIFVPVPGAILVGIASWMMYRTLQKAELARSTSTKTARGT
jgi:hypothetical protein